MKKLTVLLILLLGLYSLAAQKTDDLKLSADDIRIRQTIEGGYYLYIRKVPGIESVLLTESTVSDNKLVANYALRNPDYHPENGDEKRLLDGEFIEPRHGYPIISSTPKEHPDFGQAFILYIPYIVDYGYPWTRHGEMQVLDGTFLNIRSFAKPYADYTGAYSENPFILRLTQRPSEGAPEGNFMEETVESFQEIAEETGGRHHFSLGGDDLIDSIGDILKDRSGDSLDLVICVDTTASMVNDMPFLQKHLVSKLQEFTKGYTNLRVGLVQYKDYHDIYLTRSFPFMHDWTQFQAHLNRIRVYGGRDIPEAVYEALYAAIHEMDWGFNNDRIVILIGDAPPHPRPRGEVTSDMVYGDARHYGIEIHTIILPH